MADRFVKIEVPVTNIREVCDLDISDDKVDEIIQRVLRDEINPAFLMSPILQFRKSDARLVSQGNWTQ